MIPLEASLQGTSHAGGKPARVIEVSASLVSKKRLVPRSPGTLRVSGLNVMPTKRGPDGNPKQ